MEEERAKAMKEGECWFFFQFFDHIYKLKYFLYLKHFSGDFFFYLLLLKELIMKVI